MEEKYLEIDLLKHVPLDSYVILEPSFRLRLFREATIQTRSRRQLAKVIGIHGTTIYSWKIGKIRPSLDIVLKCAKLAKINVNKIRRSIITFGSGSTSSINSIKCREWKLKLDEKLAECLGLLVGDGYIAKKYIEFGSTEISAIFFFANCFEELFKISKDRMLITILLLRRKKKDDAEQLIKIIRSNGFNRVLIGLPTSDKLRKFFFYLRISNKLLAQIFSDLISSLEKLISKSSIKVKIAYVKGFAAAEGCSSLSGSARRILISQKDPNMLNFVRDIIQEVGIEHISLPRKGINGVFSIIISTRKELEKFKKMIGFGHNITKNKELDNLLNSYNKRISYYASQDVRYEEIKRLVKSEGRITAKTIASLLKIKYKHANELLNQMLERKMIFVDSSSKPFIYTLGDVSNES